MGEGGKLNVIYKKRIILKGINLKEKKKKNL